MKKNSRDTQVWLQRLLLVMRSFCIKTKSEKFDQYLKSRKRDLYHRIKIFY